MHKEAYIGRSNTIWGPLSILLKTKASIGNGNKITRGAAGTVSFGAACLELGELSKLTSQHRVDCTASIKFGDFTTAAGISCQIWTHGYVHDLEGKGRYRIDGSIKVGDNVYIGSGCIITAGVRINSGIIIGAGAIVSKNLLDPGLYVSASLRKLDRPVSPIERTDLKHIRDSRLCEKVYIKD